MTEEPKIDGLKENLANAKEALKQKTELEKTAAQIEAELSDYNKIDALDAGIKKDTSGKAQKEKELEQISKEKEEKLKEITALKEEQSILKDVGAELAKSKADLEKIEKDMEGLDELSESLGDLQALNEKLEVARRDYLKADSRFNEINTVYERLEQNFRDGQAGVLAQKLQEGEKCPVCGSTTHPHLAQLADNVPSEKELQKAKKDADAARGEREKASTEAGGLAKTVEAAENDLLKKLGKQLDVKSIDEAAKKLEEAMEVLSGKYSDIKARVNELAEKDKRKASLEKLIPEAEKISEQLTNTEGELKNAITAAASKLNENILQLEELRKKLKFDSQKSASLEIERLQSEAGKLQKTFDRANEELNRQNEVIVKLKAKIDSNEKTIADAKVTDVTADIEKQSKLKNSQDECITLGEIIAARAKANESIRANIIKRSGKSNEIEKKLQWVKSLSDTANGKLSGKDKVMLETYIQTTYFDRIIERANLRLMTMSAGQYELIRMKEAANAKSQSGLDLGVVDHYNGSERSVKTLSGGESFMASLSLALGLSDEVQSSAGGIRIDTMFVDEGFGSLDPEALDQAYKALAGLTEGNRLVGIISHVTDLKERIDKQLIVTKEKSGGSFVRLNV